MLDYDALAAENFVELRRQGIRVGTMDLRIACIALANQMTVLTSNLVDFERIPNLTVEDWTAKNFE